jgi:hypothetical protein
MKPKRNGIYVLEQMPKSIKALPGLENGDDWQPYKVWVADLSECHLCGTQVVAGFGLRPVSECHMENFDGWMTLCTVTVNDC